MKEMTFTAAPKDTIPEELAKRVVNDGRYLGRSHHEKDCFWGCHEYEGRYYISLNCDEMVWEVSASDIVAYNEVPSETA